MNAKERTLESIEVIKLVQNDYDEVDDLRFCVSCGLYPQTMEELCEQCLQEIDEREADLYEERKSPDDNTKLL